MADKLPPVRRIVVGSDASGKSIFLEDGPPPVVSTGERHHYKIWATGRPPLPVEDKNRYDEVTTIMPPIGGTAFRILEVPSEPLDPEERKKAIATMRAAAEKENAHPARGIRRYPDAVHPGMHETDTIDYALILAGEIYAVMDSEERLMKTGDVLIQRGNRHAWSNRSGAPCRIAFILIEGTPIKS